MIEADGSGCQKGYILKLQFQSTLADYVGLCDVADSQPQTRMVGILVYVREFSLNMRVDSAKRNAADFTGPCRSFTQESAPE
jgi:hypothetical protein